MSRPHRIGQRLVAALAAGCAGLALAGTAGAVDLRSWDMKINDVTKRFIVLPAFGSQAVLDKETQLVWHRVAGPARDWATAVIGCHGVYVEGRLGWRLPSMSELRSVLGTGGVLPVGHPFQLVSNANFWTSTDSPSSNANAFTVNPLSYQGIIINSKNIANRYLCVRGAT